MTKDEIKYKLKQIDPKFKKPFRLYTTDNWMPDNIVRACWVSTAEYHYVLINPDATVRVLAESEYADYCLNDRYTPNIKPINLRTC